jgi:putative Mg2+ transporter-C (MgtC) family protein
MTTSRRRHARRAVARAAFSCYNGSGLFARGMSIPLETMLVRLLIAVMCGAVIGFEREYRRKSAGLKTLTLIAAGSAVFTLVSIQIDLGQPARVVAQVVTGIGFLGAGVIMRSRLAIHGLTTAAVVFVSAGVGVAAGAGMREIAFAGTAVTVLVLSLARPLESVIGKRGDPVGYVFMTTDPGALINATIEKLASKRLKLEDLVIERAADVTYRVSFTVAADVATSRDVVSELLALETAYCPAECRTNDPA